MLIYICFTCRMQFFHNFGMPISIHYLICWYGQIKYWKKIISYDLGVLIPFIMVYGLLVEWKLLKMECHYIIHRGNISFMLLQRCLEISRCIFWYQNKVVSYICDMLNIINMVFWFWVEWKFFKMESLCFHNGTMILLFLQSYLENNFMYVDVYKLPNKIVFYHIHVLNLFINMFCF